jgi:aminopeptidase YwaD
MYRTFVVIILILLSHFSYAQGKKNKTKKINPDTLIVNNLKDHIGFLADDKLEGRRTGTKGEQLAMEYISNQFQSAGLQPKGTNSFYQPFEINEGRQLDPSTTLRINNTDLVSGKEYFPFPYSPDITMEAIPSIALRESDMPWFVDLKETMEENKNNPHFDLEGFIKTKAEGVKKKNASALFIYNTSDVDDKLSFNGKDRSAQLSIPVLYIAKNTALKLFKDTDNPLDIKLKIKITEKIKKGNNVIGYINNNAPQTVILGAHFDHLGYGEDGNSMLRTGEKLIHNGADDNASGTAALIELAKILSTSNSKNRNYLFIAFSGEELGLYGSKYFTENPTIDLNAASYMINMDMVGRLNDSSKVLTIGGFGTSPVWNDVIVNNDFLKLPYKKNVTPPLLIRIDSNGTGPSDHTSFYRKDIPVLFYFTGLHSDYHKPSDDFQFINYNGELQILKHIVAVIDKMNEKEKPLFAKTREAQTSGSMRSGSVTMGVMPDYTFSGTGLRCDGVSEGRPAQKAGIKAGDIILQIGDYSISSMDSYMQTLGKFKKGDKVKVKIKRGAETVETEVEF